MNIKRDQIKNLSQLGICVGLTIVLIWLISKVFAIILISPDDQIFQKIMSGDLTGTPSGYVYFIRYPLALLLSLFYRLNNSIPWYQAFLMGSLAVCFFLILDRVRIIDTGRKILFLIIFVPFIALLLSRSIIYLEWTTTAGILGATAIFRYITMPQKTKRLHSLWEYSVCLILLLLCFCLRNTVAYMYIPLAGICWIRRVIGNYQKTRSFTNKTQLRELAFISLCIISVGIVMLSHHFAYDSDDWNDYKEYTQARSTIFDYYGSPDYDTYIDTYKAAGISKEAYLLMKEDYNYLIPCDNFETINLSLIADLTRSLYLEDSKTMWDSTKNTIKSVILNEDYLFLNLAIIILVTCNYFAHKDRLMLDIILITAVVIWSIAVSLYLAYKGRLLNRIVWCIDYALILSLIGNLVQLWISKPKKCTKKLTITFKAICILLSILLFLFTAIDYSNHLNYNREKEQVAVSHMQIVQYCQANPKNVYFRDFWSFSQRGELFMRNEYRTNNYLGTGGWTYNCSIFDDMLAQWDCTDIYEATKENDNLYFLVSANRMKAVERILSYFEAENIPIQLVPVDEFSTSFETVVVLKFCA